MGGREGEEKGRRGEEGEEGRRRVFILYSDTLQQVVMRNM